MKHSVKTILATTALLAVAACGQSTSDRTLSGAGLGAGAGAVGAAVLGANPVAGAVVGGVAGGATGALTSPNQVDLGRPAWR